MNGTYQTEPRDQFTFSNLVIISRLGRGSTSHVFKVQSIRTKTYYAMKVIDKKDSQCSQQSLIQQINIHKNLSHPHICQFVKHFQDHDNHYILSEYCRNGEIIKYLMKPLIEKKIVKVLLQIGKALDYMHNEAGFAHGDLKLSNILINGQYLKLCDFGFSTTLKSKTLRKKSKNGPFGTLLYMSPQILKNNCNEHYKQADVWALGICLLILMNQGNPYHTESVTLLKKRIINAEYVEISKQKFPQYSSQLLEIVKKMLDPDFRTRITIQQIMQTKLMQKLILRQTPLILKQLEAQNQSAEQSVAKFQYEVLVQSEQSQTQDIKDINKSVFNQTVDTQTSLLSNQSNSNLSLEECKIWTYCLKSQKHKTDNQGYIHVMPDHTIIIKVQNVQYKIEPDGRNLQILKGFKNCRKYTLSDIINNEKILNLYNYAIQLVGILKKNQRLGEEVVNNTYFWVTKKSICCLVERQIILQRPFSQKIISFQRIGDPEKRPLPKQMHQYASIFESGQKELLKKYFGGPH